jgi:hypothetical protein
VCYSVAISTVFQAYLTTFLIEPGYEEPIKTVEQILRSKRKFGFFYGYKQIISDTSDPVNSAILKHAIVCLNEAECFTLATLYHNISTILDELDVEEHRSRGHWTDENNRPLLCELEDGVVRTTQLAILVRKGSPYFEIIDDVIGRIVEGGIFVHIKNKGFSKAEMDSKYEFPTFDDTYSTISIGHLQTPFYLLMLGYVLAVVCFVTEIMLHRYWSKWRGPTNTSVTDRNK